MGRVVRAPETGRAQHQPSERLAKKSCIWNGKKFRGVLACPLHYSSKEANQLLPPPSDARERVELAGGCQGAGSHLPDADAAANGRTVWTAAGAAESRRGCRCGRLLGAGLWAEEYNTTSKPLRRSRGEAPRDFRTFTSSCVD